MSLINQFKEAWATTEFRIAVALCVIAFVVSYGFAYIFLAAQ